MAYDARARALGVRIRQSTNVVRLISDDVGTVRGVLCADGHDFRFSRFDEGRPLVSLHPYAGAGEMR